MARSFLLLCVAAFGFVLLQAGDGLKCYHCHSAKDGDCFKPSANASLVKECDGNQVCYIRNETAIGGWQGGHQIARGCIKRENCKIQSDDHYNFTCTSCEKDLCNSSPSVVPSFFVVSIIAAIFAKMYLS